ncbi:hypothetical protein MTR67_041919 [Solanum verrucosum]|uniref:Uncharacterized protein n=1 Tax=Solanum verrucosum TaxID=315347 RepID=A0AAF0UMB0_SOLVR|nr:hypothetical protein MTR67_041908 [Solanum verrucosum]WMV48534.1 hypothetical protein MTR67_041919 [Solanum verrucosum]
MQQLQMEITHTYREANQLGDYITSIALEQDNPVHYHSFQDLPTKGRKILNSDKSQIPILRIRN